MIGGHINVSSYVDGRLSPEEMREAESHLLECRRCRGAVEALREERAAPVGGQAGWTLQRFFAHLLRGGAMLLEPLFRRAPRPSDQGSMQQEDFSPEPLRVLMPRVVGGVRGLLGMLGRFGIVLVLTIAVLLLPTPEGLSPEGHRALAVFVFTASILSLEPVSLPIAALMVPLAQVALGVATAPVAFQPFSRPVVFLILASLFLAEALRKHGLIRRLALTTIVAFGGGVRGLLLGLMGIAAFMAMWVGDTATAAMLIPVALTISRQVPDQEAAAGLLVLLGLGVAYGASLGGMNTIIGAAANAVTSGFLAQIQEWTFVDWMRYGVPSFLLIFPVTWWLLVKIVPVQVDTLELGPVRQQVKEMGAMSRIEKEILLLLGATAALWITGPSIESALGLPQTLFSAAMVAVMAVSYLAIREIINWEDLKGVSWGIFLIIGAGLSLGEALSRTGVTDWFAILLQPWVGDQHLLVTLLVLVLVSAMLTNFVNNATIAAIFVPVLIVLAREDPSFNAVQLVLPVTLATTFGYSLPSASGRMALLAATGIVSRGKMIRYGLVVTIVSSILLATLFYLLALVGWI
jgi:solute carrier family 13 (sodium-dependent dicarboxylate transporter), member 2/3/5